MRSTSYLKISTCWAQSSLRIRDFWQSLIKQSINQKDQQNALCQITTCELKVVLHLVKSKIYSKHHHWQFENISNSLSQIHQNNLVQNFLHSNHSLNQAFFWINLTAYSWACSTIWIVNSASNLHQSSNSVWLLLNSVIQLVKKMLNSASSTIKFNLSLRTSLWTSK